MKSAEGASARRSIYIRRKGLTTAGVVGALRPLQSRWKGGLAQSEWLPATRGTPRPSPSPVGPPLPPMRTFLWDPQRPRLGRVGSPHRSVVALVAPPLARLQRLWAGAFLSSTGKAQAGCYGSGHREAVETKHPTNLIHIYIYIHIFFFICLSLSLYIYICI